MKKRVIFFTTILGGGGAEKHMLRLVNYLASSYEVIVAVARKNGSYENQLNPKIQLIYLSRNIKSSTLSLIVSIFNLRSLIIRLKPHSIHSFMDGPNIALCLSIIDKLSNFRTVLNIQVSPLQNYKGLYAKAIHLLMKYLYPRSWKVIAISKGVASEVEKICDNRIKCDVNYNIGVTRLKSQIDIPKGNDVFRIVACGRLTEQKGFDLLIRSIHLLKNKFDLSLTILGEGPDKLKLLDLAKDLGLNNVYFEGFVNDPVDVFKEYDLFVLSSRWEGFGNVIVEAMSIGLPVIATDCPHGPREIISDDIDGKLICPNDVSALSDAITHLRNDDDYRSRIGSAGYNRSKDFTQEVIGKRYLELTS